VKENKQSSEHARRGALTGFLWWGARGQGASLAALGCAQSCGCALFQEVRSHSQLPRDPRSAKVAWETGRRCFQPGQRARQADRALRKQREGTASQETARSQPQNGAEPKAPHRASPGGCVCVCGFACLVAGYCWPAPATQSKQSARREAQKQTQPETTAHLARHARGAAERERQTATRTQPASHEKATSPASGALAERGAPGSKQRGLGCVRAERAVAARCRQAGTGSQPAAQPASRACVSRSQRTSRQGQGRKERSKASWLACLPEPRAAGHSIEAHSQQLAQLRLPQSAGWASQLASQVQQAAAVRRREQHGTCWRLAVPLACC